MMRVQVTIGYDDGTTEDVILRPVALVAAERHFAGTIPPMEGTLWAAWYQTRKAQPFADWLETIETAEDVAVPPTSATQSEQSPTSPPS